MRLYIAASYARKLEVAGLAARLEARGVEVVSDWHREIYAPSIDMRSLKPDVLQDLAQKDLLQILESDAVLFLAEDPDHEPPRGGRHVEFGFALALGKRLLVWGDPENIFHHLPNVRLIDSMEEVR